MDIPFNRRRFILAGLTAAVPALVAAQSREEPWPRGQNLVHRTLEDLRAIEAHAPGQSPKEHERYDNARRHLEGFREELQRRNFNKDRLDEAIGDVQHVLDNNRIGEHGRTALQKDVNDLRKLRADYDSWHR